MLPLLCELLLASCPQIYSRWIPALHCPGLHSSDTHLLRRVSSFSEWDLAWTHTDTSIVHTHTECICRAFTIPPLRTLRQRHLGWRNLHLDLPCAGKDGFACAAVTHELCKSWLWDLRSMVSTVFHCMQTEWKEHYNPLCVWVLGSKSWPGGSAAIVKIERTDGLRTMCAMDVGPAREDGVEKLGRHSAQLHPWNWRTQVKGQIRWPKTAAALVIALWWHAAVSVSFPIRCKLEVIFLLLCL